MRFVRNKMADMGFVEVQTPILTSSSPEGAIDYSFPVEVFEWSSNYEVYIPVEDEDLRRRVTITY